MYTYETFKSNYEVVKNFCAKYRKEITDMQARVMIDLGMSTYSEFNKFMNELTFDEFVGNQLMGVSNNETIEMYQKILDGEMEIGELVRLCIGSCSELCEFIAEEDRA